MILRTVLMVRSHRSAEIEVSAWRFVRLDRRPDNRWNNVVGGESCLYVHTERSANTGMAMAAFLGIGVGFCIRRTERHENRDTIRRSAEPSNECSRHGECLLNIQAEQWTDPLEEPAQALVDQCRHLSSMFDAHVEDDRIARSHAEPLCWQALDQTLEVGSGRTFSVAFEFSSWSCR